MQSKMFLLFVLIAFTYNSFSQVPLRKEHLSGTYTITSQSNVPWAKRARQGFNMRVWLNNAMCLGIEAWDGNLPIEHCGVAGIGLEYPIGSCIEHLYGAGPRIGAIINGVKRVTEGYNGSNAEKYFLPERWDTLRDRIWNTSINDMTWDRNFTRQILDPRFLPATDVLVVPPDSIFPEERIWKKLKRSVNQRGIDDDGDGRIDEDELDGLDNDGDWSRDRVTGELLYDSRGFLIDDVGADGIPDWLEVGCKGPYDSIRNPDPAYDNFEGAATSKRDSCHVDALGNYPRKNHPDRYTEGNGIPDHGEPNVDEDYGAVSDNDLYCSARDDYRSVSDPEHFPMGAKVFLKSYAWLRGSSADAIIFLEYHIVNAGSNVWRDVYLGMFADMDVGPINISSYWSHNYAAYDSLTRTGYVHNPRDAGSIPLGLSLLGASKPLDSLRLIWQWHEFDLPCGGFPDEDLYNCMSCEAFGNTNCIRQSQSPDSPRDTRFLFSLGPFDPVQPGDTVRMTFAFVSGLIIPDMLVNAERAHRIIESRGFIMPLATIEEQGGGEPITIRWTALERLPYGRVTSYRVYYGTNPSQYTDSLTTDSLSATFSGLTPGQVYYFAVSAIDEHGNISALSNEVSTAPTYPRGLRTINYQRSIGLQWDANHEFDIAGYNIYRRSSLDTTFSKLNTSLIAETTYVDTAVWGDRIYYYKITAIDIDGNESRFSFEVSGRLIPPAPPRNFVVGPGKTFVRLGWLQNADPDLAGYNIYRSTKLDSGFVKLNLSLWQGLTYIDSTIEQDSTYYYYVEAVDLTDAVTPSYVLLGKTVLMDQGILVVNQSLFPFRDSTAAFYGWLLREYTDTIRYPPPVSVYDFGQYSTVLWLQELPFAFGLPRAYPLALKGYLLGGGRLLVMGRRLPSLFPEFWYPFLSEFYGIDYLTEIDTTFNFVGAEGTQGFPSAMLDRQKLALTGGRLNYVERFPKRPPDQIIYTYRSDPFDPLAEGKAVGLRALDTMYKAYYLSFPLYYLDSLSAQALITDILTDFGEVTGVDDASQPLPQQYHLYQAYPNPFNPSTNVRFEVAGLGFVSLKVYDVLGREVATLVNEELRPGRYEATWNATQFASGVYYVRMAASGASGGSRFIDSKKILLMK